MDPYEAAQSVTCPDSPPSSAPTPSDDPYLGATITTYDADGRVIQVTNPVGGITYTAYDQAGEAFCTVAPYEAAQGVTCPSDAPSSAPTPSDDPYLGATITTYDPNGQVIQVTNPLGGITYTSYDGAGNVAQTIVESNDATADPSIMTDYSYDADNQVVNQTVDPDTGSAATTLSAYDPNGNVFCTVSANAYAAGSYQCPTWQASWIAAPPSPTSLYSSTPDSAQAEDVTTAFYDANGDQIQTTNPDVETSISAFDADGAAYCSSDPTNVSAWLTANPSGTYPYLCPSTPPSSPPTGGSDPGYTTTIFDAAGHTLSTTDQVGDTTSYTYDGDGNVLTTTDPRGEVSTNCYYYQDGSGQCAASAPSGGGSGDDLYSTTTPVTTADPDGEVSTYSYYPGDEADVTTTPAGETTDAYDALGDLTSVDYSDTASGYSTPTDLSYTYYPDGSRETMTDATGTTTYDYDAIGDVTSQALSASGSGLSDTTTSYGYYSTGVLASITYPAYTGHSSPEVTYTYDALGNMATETDWLGNEVTFTHDGDGNLTSQDNDVSDSEPDGTSSTAFSYDGADQNTGASSTLAQTCGGDETLTQSFGGSSGSRNPDGDLTEYTNSYAESCSGQGSYERNYSYDPAGRVVYQGSSAQGSNPDNFAYDASGDPTTISSHDSEGNFDTYTDTFDDAGEVTAQSPVSGSDGQSSTYSYDTLGDQASATVGSATTTYGFDQAAQMTSATPPSGPASTYLYNGDGLEAAESGPPTWGAVTDIDSDRDIAGVSCASSSFCVAVDNYGYATIYNGTSWSTPSDIDSGNELIGVSCATSSFCVAIDIYGDATIYNGTSWSTPSDIDSTNELSRVSCTSSSFCVAVDTSGNATIYNGTSWSTPSDIDSTEYLTGISCTSSSFCVAVDESGYVTTYDGSGWSTPSEIDTNGLAGVSCTSSSYCVAVDYFGEATTYDGTSWSTLSDIDSGRDISGVSCTSSSFCATVDYSGYAGVHSGSGAYVEDVDSSESANSLTGVACASSDFCVATDESGDAVVYAPPSVASSQLTWDTNGQLALILSDGTYDYVYGDGTTPVEEIAPGTSTPTFMTYTPSDDTWLTTNAAGDETGFWGYDAYGNLAFGTPASPFGYAGQYLDSATGLVNNRARWYQPEDGEFSTVDALLAQTDQPYEYATDDPVNGGDPTGEAPSWRTAGSNPPACTGTFTQVYAPFARKLVGGGTGTATLYCGNSSFGLTHLLKHYSEFLNGWSQYGANWHAFVAFMVYDAGHWSNYDHRGNNTTTYYTRNVGFADEYGENQVPVTFQLITDSPSGRIVTALASADRIPATAKLAGLKACTSFQALTPLT